MIQLDDKLYTSTEVADVLGVSLRSVYRYLEENKLQADIKTATGRHRFSKKNILDFLYPDGSDKPARTVEEVSETKPVKESKKTSESSIPSAPKHVETPKVEDEVEEEPIDWLAKFREAAKKYREESEKPSPTPVAPVRQAPVVEQPAPIEVGASEPYIPQTRKSAFVQELTSMPEVEVVRPSAPMTRKNFYRSSLGGLKDIAQNIDKGSRSSFLDYAFTLSAGLSLYKPIKPFSVLHVYVRSADLPFFERSLGLTATEENNAQLCLLVSDDDSIYARKDELHGLFVVSKDKLLEDIQVIGDANLVAEATGILR